MLSVAIDEPIRNRGFIAVLRRDTIEKRRFLVRGNNEKPPPVDRVNEV